MEPNVEPIVAPPPTSAPTRSLTLRTVGRWAVELGIVFVGVYAAFMLSQHQAERQQRERQAQITAALVREIEDITTNTRRVATVLPRVVAQYDSTIRAGDMPRLEPWIEPVRVRTHMWEATLQSGGLELLDVATMYRLSEFYNALDAGFAQIDQLRVLSETVLLPDANTHPAAFYDPETKGLRPKYAWYLPGMRNLATTAEQITVLGDSLVADLRRSVPAGEAP